jgi:hypothetical protein
MDQIKWFDYLWRVVSVGAQFDIARKSIGSLSTDPEALRARLGGDPVLQAAVLEQAGPQKLAGELQQFLPRLDQNQLILIVALFETFIKDIHRVILRHDPKILKPDRKVLLGHLVAVGFDAIIAEEIESEVAARDRESVRKRAEHFRDRLHAPWGPPELVDAADRATELRNRILHEEPDAKVSPEDLKDAAAAVLFIPGFVCQALVEQYPDAFNPQDRISLSGRPWVIAYNRLKRIPSGADGAV